MLTLQKGLQASYLNPREAKSYLLKDGYIYDDKLSNVNSKVYFNPIDNDLLIAYRGSKNLINDWLLTDIQIPFGNLKNTKRYKESEKVYKEAKAKYHVNHPTLIGDSLGGSLASAVGGTDKDATIITYNKGAGFWGTDTNNKSNETAYRQSGDLVSFNNLFNHNQSKTLAAKMDPLSAHNINNLEKYDIKIHK